FLASFNVPSESALAQPPFSFSYRLYVVSLSLRISVLQDYGGAHPLVTDALAEMSEAQMQMRLTHPPVRAQARSQRMRGVRAGLLFKKHVALKSKSDFLCLNLYTLQILI
ncbi:MAG: hypothetical protein Q8P20_05705, partial [bacterium]|nr:hypothetical protein [bacterium]